MKAFNRVLRSERVAYQEFLQRQKYCFAETELSFYSAFSSHSEFTICGLSHPQFILRRFSAHRKQPVAEFSSNEQIVMSRKDNGNLLSLS